MRSNNFNRWSLSCYILISLLFFVSMPVLSFGKALEKADSLPSAVLLTYINEAGEPKPVRTLDEWQTRRRQIQDSMQAAMGELPQRKDLPPLNIQVLDSVITRTHTRYNIRFSAADNEDVPAYLYIPVKKSGIKKFPAMLALHETGIQGKKITDGQTGKPNLAYAKELAERGYIVIAPDYPGFGDLKDHDFKTDRYQSGTMKSIFNNMRCVDLLQSRADVNPDKIGVIGHSLGGHNAIFTAAFDDRLKVVVSSCGWTLMHNYFNGDSASARRQGGTLWPWAQERYMPLIRDKYNLDPDKIPFEFDEVIAAIAPRAFFSNSPVNDANFDAAGIKKGIANIEAVYNFLQVPGNLQVRYPDSEHDFPLRVRWQAYHFIDSVFGLAPGARAGYSYSDNPHYFKRMELFATQKSEKKIVMLGNSLTEGGLWDTILQRTDVANRGIGSDITEGYINRLNDVFDLKPVICFIEGGVNDLSRGISQDTIISNLAKLVDTLRDENILPVLHTVTYVADNYQWHDPKTFNHSIQQLNIAIRALAKKKKAKLIDLNKKITDGKYLLKQYATSDGIHYTEATYSLWAKEIIKILQLQKIQSGSSQPEAATRQD